MTKFVVKPALVIMFQKKILREKKNHVSTLLSCAHSTIMCPLVYHVPTRLSYAHSTIMYPFDYHVPTCLSCAHWTIICPLDYHVPTRLSCSHSTIICPHDYHVPTRLSCAHSTIMCPLDYHVPHDCFKSHIAAIKRFFIFVRRSGTSLASKCKHGSSFDISFLSVTRIL